MTVRLIPLLLALSLAAPAAGQTQEDQVIAAADALFAAMRAGDGAAARALFLPEGRLLAVDADGGPPRWSTVDDFAAAIDGRAGQLIERMWAPEVRIDGPVATLWAQYDFHEAGRFSHCGVDAFQFVRRDGVWRIAQVTYTLRAPRCYSPLGPILRRGRP